MLKAGMILYDTLRVLQFESEDPLRTAEINNVMLPLRLAINEAEMIADQEAMRYLSIIIKECRPRILSLIADAQYAGNHEKFR